MDAIQLGQKVLIKGSNVSGKVTSVSDDGDITVLLDMGGSVSGPAANFSPVLDRDADGRFAPGHAGYGLNPDNAGRRVTARSIRDCMLQEMEPYFSHIGTYIGQIAKPEKKIDAMAKVAPYILPALSRVEFSDQTPRDLTLEQQLAEFISAKKDQILKK